MIRIGIPNGGKIEIFEKFQLKIFNLRAGWY